MKPSSTMDRIQPAQKTPAERVVQEGQATRLATSSPPASDGAKPASLTIGVDVSEVEGKCTGVGRYTLDLLSSWLEADETDNVDGTPSTQFVLFARNRHELPRILHEKAEIVSLEEAGSLEKTGSLKKKTTPARTVGVVRFQQWYLPRLLRRHPVDLIFCPAYAVPLASSTPSVVALHDLSFERDPTAFSKKEAWRRRFLARRSAKKAKAVITISDFSKGEIMELYGLPEERVRRVYPSCDRSIFRPSPAPEGQDPHAPLVPYFLSVGTLLNRRHIDVLIKAFATLPSSLDGYVLRIVGSNQTQPKVDFEQLARFHGVADRVHFHEHLEEAELVRLYREAALLVSLSDYEGFGLPILEAMNCGTPTLALDVGVHTELWTGLSHMVEDLQPHAVASAMTRAVAQPQPQRKPTCDATSIPSLLAEKFDQHRQAAKVLAFLRTVSSDLR